jgi:hypothetical protein
MNRNYIFLRGYFKKNTTLSTKENLTFIESREREKVLDFSSMEAEKVQQP